jgi:hypothetical protein
LDIAVKEMHEDRREHREYLTFVLFDTKHRDPLVPVDFVATTLLGMESGTASNKRTTEKRIRIRFFMCKKLAIDRKRAQEENCVDYTRVKP